MVNFRFAVGLIFGLALFAGCSLEEGQTTNKVRPMQIKKVKSASISVTKNDSSDYIIKKPDFDALSTTLQEYQDTIKFYEWQVMEWNRKLGKYGYLDNSTVTSPAR